MKIKACFDVCKERGANEILIKDGEFICRCFITDKEKKEQIDL